MRLLFLLFRFFICWSERPARYITKLDWVLPEPPYNVDRFGWMSEYGQNGEEWHFAVYLVKEDGEWKIDKIDNYFGISNK